MNGPNGQMDIINNETEYIDLVSIRRSLLRNLWIPLSGALIGMCLAALLEPRILNNDRYRLSLKIHPELSPTQCYKIINTKETSYFNIKCIEFDSDWFIKSLSRIIDQHSKENIDSIELIVPSKGDLEVVIIGNEKLRMSKIASAIKSSAMSDIKNLNSHRFESVLVNRSPDWMHVTQFTSVNALKYVRQTIIRASLFGFILGCSIAIMLDPKKKYVYSLLDISSYFEFSFFHKIPALPSESSYTDYCIQNLISDMDDSCEWYILSVAKYHPSLKLIYQKIKNTASNKFVLRINKPLLTSDSDISQRTSDVGLIVLIEPGFNSKDSLLEASAKIRSQPYIEKLILLAVNQNTPPEFINT